MENSFIKPNDLKTTLDNKELNQPILPRSAWVSNLAYLRALFKVKKALDKIEEEARILKK